MIKKINNNDILVISHIADIDGAGSIILAKKYWNDKIDYILCESRDLSEVFKEDYSKYNVVYLCDLPINSDTIKVIDANETLEGKLKQFDHHEFNEEYKPSYINYEVENNGIPTSGTHFFYRHLLEKDNKLNTPFYQTLVEAIRAYDNWDMNGDFELGKKLACIHAILGIEIFIDNICKMDDTKNFELPSFFEDLIKANDRAAYNYIENNKKKILFTTYKNHKIAVVLAEQFRSQLGHEIVESYPELDYILIINFMRMTCSLRNIKEDVDLSLVARSFHHNGGGHKRAAGFPIDSENIALIKKFINEYLDNVVSKKD